MSKKLSVEITNKTTDKKLSVEPTGVISRDNKKLSVEINTKETTKETIQKKDQKAFTPPTLEDVRKYVTEKGIPVDPEAMFYHYEANGWVQGHSGKPVKKWQACCHTWAKNNNKFNRKDESKNKALNLMDAPKE